MFTGIVEEIGEVIDVIKEDQNAHFVIKSVISSELKIDQSISHNGVCLTVVEQQEDWHKVTAISETLGITNLNSLKKGDLVNLERCLKVGDRLDGHMVQGHVDSTAKCIKVTEENGSWRYLFEGNSEVKQLVVYKGSICINGVSLTVTKTMNQEIEVAIIPYTYEHTNFQQIQVGDLVNIEFDILGKYFLKNAKNLTGLQ
ncbi:MAG: riboflavin synthase [Bacteroidota bacterium]|jgi:riboflavin synthase|nr:riboflavin synthase [Crocinitomicaceae bacterium]MEC7083535.1 riboflavin synthase [Bacteroidota bacterium]MEC7127417.1 riboflavin synthase [Bacteroidota bacterium]MEC7814319.1 riboflavin synthase [Bacteroidota bacterium]MEC7936599.1 riboflavin synthase [Bacteroidota bacterium]|tara:strand:+ start:3087 stop:3686 length:600 start_codon:yes stop_codon:yes gene_type:complete